MSSVTDYRRLDYIIRPDGSNSLVSNVIRDMVLYDVNIAQLSQ